jgi:hypothetical protein
MKRLFMMGVIIYSMAVLIVCHWPAMALTTDSASAPWYALMLVDIAFTLFAFIKLVGIDKMFSKYNQDVDDISIGELDMPDNWMYGLFGVNLIGNFGWHSFLAIHSQNAQSVYWSFWAVVELIALVLTFLFFRAAQRKAQKLASASRNSGNGPRLAA